MRSKNGTKPGTKHSGFLHCKQQLALSDVHKVLFVVDRFHHANRSMSVRCKKQMPDLMRSHATENLPCRHADSGCAGHLLSTFVLNGCRPGVGDGPGQHVNRTAVKAIYDPQPDYRLRRSVQLGQSTALSAGGPAVQPDYVNTRVPEDFGRAPLQIG